MKYAAVTVVIVVALAIASVIAYRFLKSRNHEPGGFRDWVKNPDYKQDVADYFAAREALRVHDDISDDEIQQMVNRLFVHGDEDFNFDRLKLVGVKAVPMLREALENPKTASTQFGDGGHAIDAESPFERIVDLLEPIGPADAARPLAKYITHADDHFRKHAAIALGNIGTAECIVPMLKALDDDDDYVRSYAMMGIQRGIKAKRCTKEFLDAMFPALTKLLNRGDSSISGTAPELLLVIDTDRSMPVLLSPEYFNVENAEVHYIIRALNAAGHKIPHDTLLPFLKTVKELVDKYPHDYDYAEALMAYAHNPDASAEQVFQAELKSSNKKAQEAAAEALAVLSGVANAREIVFEAMDNQEFDQLPAPQQHYYAVFIYDAEVNNGGHSQYFVNSSGDHWKSALEGLKAIGANARAKILHEAAALFGAAGPSVDNDLRHRQLAAFSARQDMSLDEWDGRYYSCDENIEALLAQYALKNKEHFALQK
jgi:HEAT repeat protein